MIEWSALISKPNLQLAWQRISTGRNLQHKRFFRHIYGGYELGLKDNLNLLHEKLKGDRQATPPTRIYLPKSSGLMRPITLLAVEDQIVLQAFANLVARHIGPDAAKWNSSKSSAIVLNILAIPFSSFRTGANLITCSRSNCRLI